MESDQPIAAESKFFTFTLRQLLMGVASVAMAASFVVTWLSPAADERSVQNLVFSPDGKTLAIGTSRHGYRLGKSAKGFEVFELLDLETHRRTTLMQSQRGKSGQGLAFSPDGKTIATATWTEGIRLWDVATKRVTKELPAGSALKVAFSSDGRRLAVYGGDSAIVWDLTSAKRTTIDGSSWVCLSPDCTKIVGQGRPTVVREISSGKEWSIPRGAEGSVLAFTPDGQRLVMCERTHHMQGPYDDVFLYYLGSRNAPSRILAANAHCVAFTLRGQSMVIAGYSNLVIWDIAHDTSRKADVDPKAWFASVACSPDGRAIATGNLDGQVVLWDAQTLQPVERFRVGGLRDLEKLAQWGVLWIALATWCFVWFRYCRRQADFPQSEHSCSQALPGNTPDGGSAAESDLRHRTLRG